MVYDASGEMYRALRKELTNLSKEIGKEHFLEVAVSRHFADRMDERFVSFDEQKLLVSTIKNVLKSVYCQLLFLTRIERTYNKAVVVARNDYNIGIAFSVFHPNRIVITTAYKRMCDTAGRNGPHYVIEAS